jgi:hypothetical protein
MARRQIGTGTTDSNGKITVPYTGSGAGKIQIVAVNSNLVSETYTLIDGLWYDTGKTTTATTDYDTLRMSQTVTGAGRVLTATSDSGHFFLKNNQLNYALPFCIEIDVTSRTTGTGGGTAIDLYDGANELRIWLNSTGHYKINVDENGVTAAEGSQSINTTGDLVSGTVRASLYCVKADDTMTYHDCIIYII